MVIFIKVGIQPLTEYYIRYSTLWSLVKYINLYHIRYNIDVINRMILWLYDRFHTVKHLLGNKNHTAIHRNPKKSTTFVFDKRSVTYLRKFNTLYLIADIPQNG